MTSRRQMGWVALGVAGLLAAVSALDARGFRHYVSLRDDLENLEVRNQRLTERNREMAREVGALRHDPRALERAAREELGFLKPGEIVINLE